MRAPVTGRAAGAALLISAFHSPAGSRVSAQRSRTTRCRPGNVTPTDANGSNATTVTFGGLDFIKFASSSSCECPVEELHGRRIYQLAPSNVVLHRDRRVRVAAQLRRELDIGLVIDRGRCQRIGNVGLTMQSENMVQRIAGGNSMPPHQLKRQPQNDTSLFGTTVREHRQLLDQTITASDTDLTQGEISEQWKDECAHGALV